ncbi:MAG: GerMN domain-containing protein [Gaiellaceae bacterium]
MLTLGPASAEDDAVPERGTRTTVYFLADHGVAPIGVRRTIDPESPHARKALLALLAGPTTEERQAGITSAIPPGTEIRSLTFRGYGGTGAVVDVAALPGTYDAADRMRVITQISRTLIGVSGIERVWLRSGGRPWGFWSMDGEMQTKLGATTGSSGLTSARPSLERRPSRGTTSRQFPDADRSRSGRGTRAG